MIAARNGEVYFLELNTLPGLTTSSLVPQDRDVAIVFQTPALYPQLTAFENLAFGLRVRKAGPAEVDRRVRVA